MIYFTSDLHFCHNKNFLFEPRVFNSIEEHNKQIVENWNSIVTDDDTVYVLGDLMLNDTEEGIKLFNTLKGHKKIIYGNHDTDNRMLAYQNSLDAEFLGYANMIKYHGYTFYLSHYPTKVGNYDDESKGRKLYCLCGHTHTKDKWLDFNEMKAYHVELDAHKNKPVSVENIIADIQRVSSKPNKKSKFVLDFNTLMIFNLFVWFLTTIIVCFSLIDLWSALLGCAIFGILYEIYKIVSKSIKYRK